MDWFNVRLAEHKKVFSKDIYKENIKGSKPNYILMLVNGLIYVGLLYAYGIGNTVLENINLIKFVILTPMLLSVFVIDYHHKIIPNRLNLTIFEVGLVFVFIQGIFNLNIVIDMLLGMVVGGGIFLLITLIGGMIAGKEAMGFGDVKLMGALGLFFGWANMLVISMISFLVGAVLSIILLVSKKKKSNEYIPFGPFIVIGTFITMLVPFGILVNLLLKIFTLGMFAK